MNERTIPSPQPWPETRQYWDAANDGILLLKRCLDTGKVFHYPRAHSPFTGSANTEWCEVSGEGTIYSYSVLNRADPPYCIAYVTLAEGPTVLTNVVTDDFDSLRIGQPVRVEFVASENGQKVPVFRPC